MSELIEWYSYEDSEGPHKKAANVLILLMRDYLVSHKGNYKNINFSKPNHIAQLYNLDRGKLQDLLGDVYRKYIAKKN